MNNSLIVTTAADVTLRKRQRHTLVLCTAADVIVNLPASDNTSKGQRVAVKVGVASTGTGAQVNPATGDTIHGKGITASANKNLINTGATDAVGDLAELVSDGAGGWHIVNLLGTWAREA